MKLATISYMAMLLAGSLLPGAESDAQAWYELLLPRPAIQNLSHIPAYGLLTMLWLFWLKAERNGRLGTVAGAITVAVTYGAVMEVLQGWVPGRFPSLLDVAFNGAGALMAVCGYLALTPPSGAEEPTGATGSESQPTVS